MGSFQLLQNKYKSETGYHLVNLNRIKAQCSPVHTFISLYFTQHDYGYFVFRVKVPLRKVIALMAKSHNTQGWGRRLDHNREWERDVSSSMDPVT